MLRTRIISALVMGLVLLLALLFLPQPGWALFAIIVLGVAAWEWAGFARLPATSTSGETRDSRGLSRLIYALCAAMLCGVAAWWTGLFDSPGNRDRIAMIYLIGAVFWLIGVPIWLARLPPRPARPMVLAAGLFVLLPAYVAILDLRLFGVLAIILVMAIAWVADVAAYFAGHRFGRNKLAPRVSPGTSKLS